MAREFQVTWNEDGGATVLGRITARDGSGAATGISGEGNWLEPADVATITCKVFDLDSATPNTAFATPTVTVVTSVVDPPVTSTAIWTLDSTGYNFIHDLAASNFPTGKHRIRVEYEVTLTGGGKFHGAFTGRVKPIRGS
jgi:hypothetical protein